MTRIAAQFRDCEVVEIGHARIEKVMLEEQGLMMGC